MRNSRLRLKNTQPKKASDGARAIRINKLTTENCGIGNGSCSTQQTANAVSGAHGMHKGFLKQDMLRLSFSCAMCASALTHPWPRVSYLARTSFGTGLAFCSNSGATELVRGEKIRVEKEEDGSRVQGAHGRRSRRQSPLAQPESPFRFCASPMRRPETFPETNLYLRTVGLRAVCAHAPGGLESANGASKG